MLIDVDNLLTMASMLPIEKKTYKNLIQLINEIACAEAIDDLYSMRDITEEKNREFEKDLISLTMKDMNIFF